MDAEKKILEQNGELHAVACLMTSMVAALSPGLQATTWREFDAGRQRVRAFLVEHGASEDALRGFDSMIAGITRMRG